MMPKVTKKYTVKGKWQTVTGLLHYAYYGDGSRAVVLGEAPDRLTLSINLIDHGLTPPTMNHIFVPDYSEHEGLPEAVAEAGIAVPIEHVTFGRFGTTAMLMLLLPTDHTEGSR